MGIDTSLGAMEGKETRIGAAATGYWSIATTVISTGSVNSMHDSTMPLSGMNELLAMMINSFYGGVGVGILNFFIFIILAVFISGLMVGRTPEFFGKKVEAREMKIAMIIALIHPFLILVGTALTAAMPEYGAATLNNPGFHGLSEMLYEFTSASANNGSGFEGLGDNTVWWNVSTGIVLILARFLPIIGPVAIAGLLAAKKYIPESDGTLRTDTATFGLVTLTVILIIAALAFFQVLALGPIAEYFTIY
jgi:K+-transporting ATPase ATPase A chain